MESLRSMLLPLLMAGACTGAFAQKGVVTTGGDATGAGGQVNYSVGQTDYISGNGSGGIVSQGNQQTYTVTDISGLAEDPPGPDLSVYPNPANDHLILRTGAKESRNLHYRITGPDGRLITEDPVDRSELELPVQQLAKGTYILTVFDGRRKVKTFKIIKN